MTDKKVSLEGASEVSIVTTGPTTISRPALRPGEEIRVGCTVAQRLTSALTSRGIPYGLLSDIIYGEFREISKEMRPGDWLELPDGSTWVKEARHEPEG